MYACCEQMVHVSCREVGTSTERKAAMYEKCRISSVVRAVVLHAIGPKFKPWMR